MRKSAQIAACLLAATSASLAQAPCPPPTLKVLCNNREVLPAGAPIVPRAFLRIVPGPGCAAVRYEFKEAELTLMRGSRPLLATRTVRKADINMLDFARTYQPGDRLYIFIPFRSLVVVAVDGSKAPYRPPARPPNPPESTSAPTSRTVPASPGYS